MCNDVWDDPACLWIGQPVSNWLSSRLKAEAHGYQPHSLVGISAAWQDFRPDCKTHPKTPRRPVHQRCHEGANKVRRTDEVAEHVGGRLCFHQVPSGTVLLKHGGINYVIHSEHRLPVWYREPKAETESHNHHSRHNPNQPKCRCRPPPQTEKQL